MNSSAYVTGSTTPGGCPVLSDVELGDIFTNNDNSNIGLTEEGENPFQVGPNGLKLNSGDSLTLPGGRYYFTQFEVNSSATITVDGPTVIYVTGMFKIDSSSRVLAQTPEDFIVLDSSSVGATINSDSDFTGFIYAPNTKAVLDSSIRYYGGLMANEVTINSDAFLHADEALKNSDVLNDLGINTSGGASTGSSTLVQ